MVIYVFGQQNGRIRDEDVVAFDAINKAYPLNAQSLLFIVNGLPKNRPQNYEGQVLLMLQDIIKFPVAPERVCFLDQIKQDSADERQAMKSQLLQFIIELTPTFHTKQQDIHLRVDEVSFLKEQIKQMTNVFEDNKIYFQNEIRQQQARYDRFVENQRAESEHFRRIIERQHADADEMRREQEKKLEQSQQAHTSQISIMQEQIKNMREEHERLSAEMAAARASEKESIQKALEQSRAAQEALQRRLEALINRPPQIIVCPSQPSSSVSAKTCPYPFPARYAIFFSVSLLEQ